MNCVAAGCLVQSPRYQHQLSGVSPSAQHIREHPRRRGYLSQSLQQLVHCSGSETHLVSLWHPCQVRSFGVCAASRDGDQNSAGGPGHVASPSGARECATQGYNKLAAALGSSALGNSKYLPMVSLCAAPCSSSASNKWCLPALSCLTPRSNAGSSV